MYGKICNFHSLNIVESLVLPSGVTCKITTSLTRLPYSVSFVNEWILVIVAIPFMKKYNEKHII